MVQKEFCWTTEDGVNIFGQLWQPVDETRAVVCLVHGLGEHSSRYKTLPRRLVDAGFALVAFDMRGHGKSGGKRGHTPSYKDMMDGISRLLGEASVRFPEKDLFLYGHSMGGNLVINYALRYKSHIKGVIATGPWLRLSNPPGPCMIRVAKLLDRFWPSLRTWNGIKPKSLSHREKEKHSAKDPYMHPWISMRTFVEVHEAGYYALRHAADLRYPLLLLHGSEDNVTSAEASREFARSAKDNCSIIIYEGLYHEVHNEPRNEEIFSDVVSWLDSNLSLADSSTER